jgi:hypothetical protein
MKKLILFFLLLPSLMMAQNLLFNVDFSGSFPPSGWTIDAYATNWSAVNSNNAGGTAPEARFNWSPQFTGDSRLISPAINTSGNTLLFAEFKFMLDHYAGPYTIGVATRSGGGAWNVVWQIVNPTGSISATTEVVTINNADVGATDFQICWFFSGNSYNLNYWYLDDLKLIVPMEHDAMTKDILVDQTYPPGTNFVPQAILKNFGQNSETFDATCILKLGGSSVYTQNCSPVTLAPGEEQTVSFPDYILNAVNDLYEITVTTNLAGDMDPTNDSKTEYFNTYTTEREMVILEIGTGTWCQYCPGSQMGADDLVSNGCSVAVVEYHNGDSFTNAYSNARISYYGISGFPTAVFDGVDYFVGGSNTQSMYQYYLPIYEGRKALMSAFSVDIFGDHTGLDYNVLVRLNRLATIPPTWNNLVVHFTVTETGNPFNWQGQTEVDYCERLMVPDQNGTSVDLINNTTIDVPLSFTLDASWVVDNCQLAAFVQNLDTKEILQGDKVWITDLQQYSNVTVESPNGGEIWTVGETEDITWTSVNVNDVKIEISVDNGVTWSTIADSIPNTGAYSWVVAAQDTSDECLVKITNLQNSNVYDESDTLFTIENPTGIEENKNNRLPIEFDLVQNYPNPFNPSTRINYAVPETTPVTIKVYDIIGQEIAVLVNEVKEAGIYELEFDANKLTSGVYIYRMVAGNFTAVKKMNVLK